MFPQVEIRPAVSGDAASVDRIARGEVWVATDGDELSGFVVLRARPDSMLLESVAVSAPYRGQRVGRALIGFAERRAHDLGLGSVELYTNAMMTENLRYYPRLGYVEYDRRPRGDFSVVFMRKRLLAGA